MHGNQSVVADLASGGDAEWLGYRTLHQCHLHGNTLDGGIMEKCPRATAHFTGRDGRALVGTCRLIGGVKGHTVEVLGEDIILVALHLVGVSVIVQHLTHLTISSLNVHTNL